MNKGLFVCWSSFVVGLSMTTPTSAEGLPESAMDATAITQAHAKELYQRANALYMKEDFANACLLYKAVWALLPNYRVAANLGSCEYEIGKYRDAAEHLAFTLREQPANTPEAERAYFAERQSKAAQRVATLDIRILNAGAAEVFIDNKPIGNAPLKSVVYVNPGVHMVHGYVSIASGYERIDVSKGESRIVSLELLPPPRRTPPLPERAPTSNILFGVGGGLATALLIGGTYAAAMHMQNPHYSQPKEPLPTSKIVFAWGGLIGSGVIGLATLTAVFATSRTPTCSVSAHIRPQPGNWYLGIEGRF